MASPGLLVCTLLPALLILWGVIELVEYQQASRSGGRSAGIGAGGVILRFSWSSWD